MDKILRDYGRLKLIQRGIDPRSGDDLLIQIDGETRKSFNSITDRLALTNAHRLTLIYRKALSCGALV